MTKTEKKKPDTSLIVKYKNEDITITMTYNKLLLCTEKLKESLLSGDVMSALDYETQKYLFSVFLGTVSNKGSIKDHVDLDELDMDTATSVITWIWGNVIHFFTSFSKRVETDLQAYLPETTELEE